MAELFKKVGITKTDKLVEVQRPDLVAEFVGQTGECFASQRVCLPNPRDWSACFRPVNVETLDHTL